MFRVTCTPAIRHCATKSAPKIVSTISNGSRKSFSTSIGNPIRNVWEGFNNFAFRHKFITQVGIATTKTSIADIIVQKQVERKKNIDWRRNFVFIVFGGAYLGVLQYAIYVKGYSRLFNQMETFCAQPIKEKIKNRVGIKQLFQQIALDFTFVQPIIYFPVYYMFKGFVDADVNESLVDYAWDKWKTNFFQDNFGMMAFWFPMDIIIYSVPVHLRLPLNHLVSFVWCCILSFYRGRVEHKVVEDTSIAE